MSPNFAESLPTVTWTAVLREQHPPPVTAASLLVTEREGKKESRSNYPPLPASYVNGRFRLK